MVADWSRRTYSYYNSCGSGVCYHLLLEVSVYFHSAYIILVFIFTLYIVSSHIPVSLIYYHLILLSMTSAKARGESVTWL